MSFYFTKGQLNKLSDFCIDISKGLLLASIAAPAISLISFIDSLFGIFIGLTFLYLSLKMEELKENI